VGNGNIDVGNKTANREPGRPIIGRLSETEGSSEPSIDRPKTPKGARPGICGAMSQQSGDNGNVSAPQKFVRLVGCREPQLGATPWVRPGPLKR
jgi:hypothetical protein